MKIGRKNFGYLFGLGCLLLMAVALAWYLLWKPGLGDPPPDTGAKRWRAAGTSARPTAPERPQRSSRGAAGQRWDAGETVGEEGEVVEVVYDEGWQLVGERARGVESDGVVPFQVPARKVEDIPMFPCSECHKGHDVNNLKRTLKKEHLDIELAHGDGRFWCDGCHDGASMDLLSTIDGRLVDMDLGYLLCGQCHFREMTDWQQAVHGKRIGFWAGVRVIRTCTECHNAHKPAVGPYEPDGPPSAPEGHPPSDFHTEHETEIIRDLAGGKEQP
ncbi:MAG: hypothetical protein V3S29_02810 [bacterium]